MDGNGRWAVKRGLNRCEGHRRGKDSLRAVVETARQLGIPYLTLFAFSNENWQRPKAEVRFLMQLFYRYLITESKRLMKRDIRVIAVGEMSRLPPPVHSVLTETIRLTANNGGMTVVLALSYGGRQDVVEAARRIAEAAASGRINPHQVDEQMVQQELMTGGDSRSRFADSNFGRTASV